MGGTSDEQGLRDRFVRMPRFVHHLLVLLGTPEFEVVKRSDDQYLGFDAGEFDQLPGQCDAPLLVHGNSHCL